MIGVVVWSSAAREKSVIWCEDQGALAYLQGAGNMIDARNWPEPGDLVELEEEMQGALRCARSVTLLSERHCPELADILRKSIDPCPEPLLRLVPADASPRHSADRRPADPAPRLRCAGLGG